MNRASASARRLPDRPSGLLKFKLTIAYEGTHYHGWQLQREGNTVQHQIETVLRRLFPSVRRIHGSSRTDTGVHALGMVAHVEIPKSEFRMTARKLPLAMNAFLPEDIRVVSASRVPMSFHARFDAVGKQYRYQIWNHRAANPLFMRLAWHVPVALDTTAMKAAAPHFLGKQDFRSLAANRDYEMETTVRTLYRCDVKRSGPMITIVMQGDGFLYKMCRAIAGTLCQVGHHKISPDCIPILLQKRARRYAGMTAPAQGLTLHRVFYSTTRGSEGRSS